MGEIEVVSMGAEAIASLSLEPMSTVSELRALVAGKLSTTPDLVQLTCGERVLTDSLGGLVPFTMAKVAPVVVAVAAPAQQAMGDDKDLFQGCAKVMVKQEFAMLEC